MTQEWGDLVFDGVSLSEKYGLTSGTPEDVLFPKWRERKQAIPGRDGRYDYGARNHEERPYKIKCVSHRPLSRAEVRELAYLLSKKSTIRNWDEPDKHYIGQLCNEQALERLTAKRDGSGRIGLKLEFTCEPYAYGEISTQELSMGTNTVNYKGTAETPCLLILQNTGETAVSSVRIGAASMSESYAGIYQYSLTRFGLRGEGMRVLSDCRLEVEMAPGDELRINSENFTATLNGENMLHLQRGSWPMMSRDVNALTIEAEGGEVSGTLVYQERWL